LGGGPPGGGAPSGGGGGGPPPPAPQVLFYVAVPSVAAALAQAERLGGRHLLGPEPPGADFSVGRFADPEGNVVGVAGPA
jgi:predicted enzyme related to lactoylglutathione lyase